MALFKKKENFDNDNPFSVLEGVSGDELKEVSFSFSQGKVKVWMRDGRVLAVSSPKLFPMNINARTYWSNSINDSIIKSFGRVTEVGEPDEGFLEYVSLATDMSDELANYFLAKEITIMNWVNNQYKKGNFPEVTVSKSNHSLELAQNSYEGSGYSTLTPYELAELVHLESMHIQEYNDDLGLLSSDYSDVYYNETDVKFDTETPFDNDVENLVLSAAAKKASLKQVKSISGGFLWSDVLAALKTLESGGVIVNTAKEGVNSFFHESLEVVKKQGEREAEMRDKNRVSLPDMEEVTIEESVSIADPLPSLDQFNEEESDFTSTVILSEDAYPSEEAETVSLSTTDEEPVDSMHEQEEISLTLGEVFPSSTPPRVVDVEEDDLDTVYGVIESTETSEEGVLPSEEETVAVDEITKEDVAIVDVPEMEEETFVEDTVEKVEIGQEVVTESLDEEVSLKVEELDPNLGEIFTTSETTDKEIFDETKEPSKIEEAKNLSAMIPMAMTINNYESEKITEATFVLDENVEAESSLEEINSSIDSLYEVYTNLVSKNMVSTDDNNEDKDELNETWLSIENIERDRENLVNLYLENLYVIEELLSEKKNKEMKEIREVVRERIQSLQDIENIAYYSEEERIEDVGPEDDIISEAFAGNVVDEYKKSVEDEYKLIQKATDPYGEVEENKPLPTIFKAGETPIFDKLVEEKGLSHLFN